MDSPSDAEKWDVNQERVFLENLMQTRFNFFLVVFGLWMVTVASITPKLPKLVFLGFGIVICSLLWLTIRRICQKVIAAFSLHDARGGDAVAASVRHGDAAGVPVKWIARVRRRPGQPHGATAAGTRSF